MATWVLACNIGAVKDYPATRPVKTFPVRVEDNGDIYIQVK